MEVRLSLTPDDVRELADMAFDDKVVLSLYLDLSPSLYPTKRDVEEQANSLIESALRRLERTEGGSPAYKDAHEDARHARRFIELEFSREGGAAAALFVCRAKGLERCYVVGRPLRSRASFDKSPYVRPLNSLLSEYSPFGVILCNRRSARLLRFHMGRQTGEERVIEDQVHGKHDQGGWAQARYARHIEQEAHHHFKRVAAAAEEYFSRDPVSHIVLAGPVEDRVELKACLPSDLEKRVVRELSLDINVKPAELASLVDEVDAEIEREEDARLVERVRSGVGSGSAVAGLEDTLRALSAGRVELLVVSRGYVVPGWKCPQCSGLSSIGPRCTTCGTDSAERVDDVIEEAVQAVLKNGGKVELVTASADLDVLGRVGALLRY